MDLMKPPSLPPSPPLLFNAPISHAENAEEEEEDKHSTIQGENIK